MPETCSEWHAAANRLSIDPRAVIGGQRSAIVCAAGFDTRNPATGAVVASYAEGGAAQCDAALAAARHAFDTGPWPRLPVAERIVIIEDWADHIRNAAETLALIDCLEMGMPIAQALDDVAYSANLMVETARIALTVNAPAGLTAPGTLVLNLLEPVGVVAAITPWNFPINQALARIVAPLVMGNCVVLKPSEVASGSALLLAELGLAAGLPEGVLNAITGTGAVTGAALVGDSRVDRIGFTGSTATGARIQALAAAEGIPRPMAMELGGKSPHVVGESFSDLTALAPVLAHSVFWNAGQVCSAGSRLLVHESRADELLGHLRIAAAAFVPGDPLDPATTLGPIATAAQRRAIDSLLDRSRSGGLVPVLDGDGLDGLALGPTIFDHVPAEAEIAREEIFGPVLAITRFSTADEAAQLANASGFGLIATVWTRDMAEGHMLARRIRAGSVSVNAEVGAGGEVAPVLGLEPAGRSGFGPDYGHAGLMQYARLKLVSFNTPA